MSGFQFKQFYIEHQHCAMKVGTDAIMLGSWIHAMPAQNVLDIGTGSGLLAIMLAQKLAPDCRITGIDLDEGAITQAHRNAQACSWTNRLTFLQQDLRDFKSADKFQIIVSNPPFYAGKKGQLSTDDPHFIEASRRNARHQMAMPQELLLSQVSQMLDTEGLFYCVLPLQQAKELLALSEQYSLRINRQMYVRHEVNGEIIRVLMAFSTHAGNVIEEHMVIRESDGAYTSEYRNLCKAYYQHF